VRLFLKGINMAWIATGWVEVETGPGAQAKIDDRLSATEKALLTQQFYASKSGGTYYIDEDVCIQSGCAFVSYLIHGKEFRESRTTNDYLRLYVGGIYYYIVNYYNPRTGSYVYKAADGSTDEEQAALIAETINTYVSYSGVAAIAYGPYLFVAQAIYNANTYEPTEMEGIAGNKPCVVIAEQMGDCSYTELDGKHGNIFYNAFLSSAPIVMGNCKACDACVNVCPFSAIKNRYNKQAQTLSSLNADFAYHYIKNSRAVLGSNL
jgi:ferredoxin